MLERSRLLLLMLLELSKRLLRRLAPTVGCRVGTPSEVSVRRVSRGIHGRPWRWLLLWCELTHLLVADGAALLPKGPRRRRVRTHHLRSRRLRTTTHLSGAKSLGLSRECLGRRHSSHGRRRRQSGDPGLLGLLLLLLLL